MEATTTLTPGQAVIIALPPESPFFATKWFPKDGATGTVQKVFKNGKVAVAVDQLRNQSEDGRRTLHISSGHLVPR